MKNAIKNIKKTTLFIMRVLRIIILSVVGSVFVYGAMVDFASSGSHDLVHNQYERYEHSNIYYEVDIANETDIELVYNALDKLPKGLLSRIENDWLILISEESPFDSFATENKVMGTAYYQECVIWLHPDFEMHQFYHECGHVYDLYAGHISQANEFKEIYKNNWDKYLLHEDKEVENHCVSDSSEYFAEMFAEYVMYKDHLKDNNVDVCNYIEKHLSESWRLGDVGMFICRFERLQFVLRDKFCYVGDNIASRWNRFTANKIFGRKIKLEEQIEDKFNFEYPDAEKIYNTIIDVAKNPDNYGDLIKIRVANKEYPVALEANSALKIYFADASKDFVEYNPEVVDKEILYIYTANKSDILAAEEMRQLYMVKVEDALKTIKDGRNEVEKLTRITTFMYKYAEYGNILEDSSSKQFWDDKTCNGLSYAMVFKQMCNRLNIECDIGMTPLYTGTDHYFNIVYIDGKTYYYDIARVSENKFAITNYDFITYDVNIVY